MPHPRPRSRRLAAVCLAVLTSLAACSGKGGPPPSRVSSEFTSRDAVLFDNGVDFITSTLALEGHWRDEWVAELQGRVARADAIAGVSIQTLRTDISPQGETTYRIGVEVNDTLHGTLGGELSLVSSPAQRGYRTIDAHTDNVEQGRFLVFVKWTEGETGGEQMRWHLAPDAEEVRAAVRKMLERAPADLGPNVTVHEQKE